MKSKLIAVTLFTMTAAAVVTYPAYQSIGANLLGNDPVIDLPVIDPIVNEKPRIEVVFVLDTTGSMSGMIDAAKEKIWSIASNMASAQIAPDIKMGLVAYRDRGDAYVTQTVDLSEDLDSVYATLMDFQADGGGDGPESVNQALYDAVHSISWSQDDDTYRVVFLVGDAPAHMDYQDDVKYPVTIRRALQKGIVINTIQCGQDPFARKNWLQVAQLGSGEYFQVDQAGSAIAIATPFDKKLAELSIQLNDTRMIFGNAEEKRQYALKSRAIDKLERGSSVATLARRAVFNSTVSGKKNLLGSNELIEAVTSGKVDLDSIDEDNLPAAMQSMAPAEREVLVAATAETRYALQEEIQKLSKDRADFLKEKVEEAGGARDSLDDQIYRVVKAQAGKIGLRYESEAAEY